MTDVHVSSTEFQKRFGKLREAALRGSVTITHHGRDSLVLIAADEYRRLKSRDRRALHITELTEEEFEALLEAEIPGEAAAFDGEVG
ncbi:MAG TPA: type II toxin-antitoxin system Phd/YefM family antitoxin [Caulobacteraceae bacterium]|nr:type II toxin-antitoxin system Phd/YefM family antitoxin [Caulobacteraceae bacterium]